MKLNWIKPAYLQHFKLVLIYVLFFSAIFFVLYKSLRYTFPFLVAFILAWILQPGMRLLVKRFRLRPTLAAFVMTLFFFTLIFGLLTWMIIGIVHEATQLIEEINPEDFAFITVPFQNLLERLTTMISQIDMDLLQQYESQLISLAQGGIQIIDKLVRVLVLMVATLPVWLTMFFVIIFSTFFLSRDLGKLQLAIQRIFADSFLEKFRSVWSAGLGMIGRYIRSYLMVYTITFILTLIFFSIIRIPYALLLSLTAGIADVLPILGLGLVYWPLAAFLFIDGQTGLGVAVLIAWVVITAIRQFVEPKLVADSIEMHPVVILAILFFGLRARSLMLIIYLTLLLMVYQMVKKAGLFIIVKEKIDKMPPVVAKSEPPEPTSPDPPAD